MPSLSRCLPSEVDGCVGVLSPCSEEREVVDHALFGQVDVHALVVFSNRLIWYLDNPEQARLRDVSVEIVDLCSRTGIEKVNSYEHEGATMVCAVSRDVFAAVEAHV